jgi:ATP-dependent Clp protease ATP-binding subunit ClpX
MKQVKDIYEYLDKYIEGQEEAKKCMAVLGFIHQLRLEYNLFSGSKMVKRPVPLLIGPTGSGKTYLLKKFSEYLDFPICNIAATNLTPTGYVGDTFKDVLVEYYAEQTGKTHNDADFTKTSASIVFIDEVDKITKPTSDTQANWPIAIQSSLLTLLEGGEVSGTVGRGMSEKYYSFNTDNMFIMIAGNFESIRDELKKSAKPSMGFQDLNKDNPKLKKKIHELLIEDGMLPELAGRISTVVSLDELSDKQLEAILKNKKDSVYVQYKKLLETCGIKLELTKEMVDNILEYCKEAKVGARGLQAGMDKEVIKLVYDAKPKAVVRRTRLPAPTNIQVKISNDILPKDEIGNLAYEVDPEQDIVTFEIVDQPSVFMVDRDVFNQFLERVEFLPEGPDDIRFDEHVDWIVEASSPLFSIYDDPDEE